MAVLTHARIPATTAYQPHSLDYLALNPAQREQAARTLADLGIDTDGATTGDDGCPDPTYRASISATTAHTLGMHLPCGHELALCHDCLTLGSAQHMRQGPDGAWRCTQPDPHGHACHTLYAAEHELHL
ncbi:hypothetical protein [Streptomyces sp.]|uniref:hypothetical protein n=1 Tax=Streptomyces sp. TaxID=1931 RepID=UPI002F4250F2